jgi:hypothetical protein
MDAEEEREHRNDIPRGTALFGYWVIEALGLCEVPLRMLWHCQMGVCVCVTTCQNKWAPAHPKPSGARLESLAWKRRPFFRPGSSDFDLLVFYSTLDLG